MKATDLFVRGLESEGVEFLFGIPGEENLDLLESLRASKIKLILTRHEQAAGFMAATYGRLTGKAGVCLATLGPGATNLVTAAAYAQLGGMPMLMITGQKPIKKSKQGKFQIVDVIEMMRPLTKFTKQIVNGSNIPVLVREAVRIAEEERPGAVHLELPEDVASEQVDATLLRVSRVRRPAPDAKAITQAVEMIEKAQHPLLLLGAAANRKRTSAALKALLDKTEIPWFNTQMGKGVVDERHSNFLGTASLSAHDYLHCAIDRADLIINVGHDVIEKPPFFMQPGAAKVIHINFFSAQVDEVYFPQLELIGDIATTVQRIGETVTVKSHWDFTYTLRVKQEFEQHIAEQSAAADFPIKPQRLVADIRAVVPADGIVALDNGMYKIWFARNYKAYEANTLLLDNALATMGAGLPSAMAARLVCPKRKIVVVCGDGGFMMNSQELETALRLRMDLVVLILKDDAYGMIKWKQQGMGFADFGLDYSNPDFVHYAQSYGAKGHRVTATDELKTLLQRCLNTKGVHLIEAPIDYGDHEKGLYQQLAAKTCQI